MFKKIIKYLKRSKFYLWLVIPKGDYCYKFKKIVCNKEGEMPILKTKICPFWSWDKRYPDEEIGYCKYLNESTCLISDQVKECGINEYE